MITNFFIPELNNHDVQELWFQQDGATCHTALATIDLLKDTLGDRLISRFGPSLVYADKPQTLDHLEDNIRRVIADIRPQMLEKVIQNWTSRLDYIRASRGSSMPEIIFKILQCKQSSVPCRGALHNYVYHRITQGSFQVIPGVSQNEGRLLILQDHWHAGEEVHKTRPLVPQDYKNAESGSPQYAHPPDFDIG
ncbi:putative LOC100569746 [Trichonephila clavipes]|nr:putative LOC100569746 [Trichonephila clavipes]